MDTTHASLLIRVRSPQDSAAWREFDEIYRPMLLRFAVARGLSHDDAEDVVQHCMEATARHIAGFENDPAKGRFRGWLRTLVNNRVRTLLRDRRDVQADTEAFVQADGREDAPDALFEKIWRQEHLRHCLARMRSEVEDSSFRAFTAVVMEERPVEEVCRELDMNPNQVHLIKWRLTKKLRQHMTELLGEAE
jgi:RNA polymerase sigma-70 factor (ECF subfamily)